MTDAILPPLSLMGSLRWDVVRRLLPRVRGASVLEIGCGEGAVAARLAAAYEYLGVELDAVSAATAVERLATAGRGEVRQGDLSVVEVGRLFDIVLAFEVIEHIEHDAAAIEAWVNCLRPGGTLIISTPGYRERYGPMDEMVGHFRRYEPAELAALLRDGGLDDVSVLHYGAPLAYLIEPVRNVIARRRTRRLQLGSMADRTGHSGRTLQPRGRAVGVAIEVATAPVKAIQRRFPQRGPVLVARGRRLAA